MQTTQPAHGVKGGDFRARKPAVRRCQLRPAILPPFTSTAPTIGLGEVVP